MRVVATCVILSCMVALATPGRISRQARLPTNIEVNFALKDRTTVMKALACVRGDSCNLPHGNLLRQAGPELILNRTCNRRICTRKQEIEALELIKKIARHYPVEFAQTFQALQSGRSA